MQIEQFDTGLKTKTNVRNIVLSPEKNLENKNLIRGYLNKIVTSGINEIDNNEYNNDKLSESQINTIFGNLGKKLVNKSDEYSINCNDNIPSVYIQNFEYQDMYLNVSDRERLHKDPFHMNNNIIMPKIS